MKYFVGDPTGIRRVSRCKDDGNEKGVLVVVPVLPSDLGRTPNVRITFCNLVSQARFYKTTVTEKPVKNRIL